MLVGVVPDAPLSCVVAIIARRFCFWILGSIRGKCERYNCRTEPGIRAKLIEPVMYAS